MRVLHNPLLASQLSKLRPEVTYKGSQPLTIKQLRDPGSQTLLPEHQTHQPLHIKPGWTSKSQVNAGLDSKDGLVSSDKGGLSVSFDQYWSQAYDGSRTTARNNTCSVSHGADILAGEIDTKQLARQLLLDVYVITAKTVSTQNREISHGLRPYFAPPSMRFSRQKYWSGLPFPSPEDLPDPGIESRSPTL